MVNQTMAEFGWRRLGSPPAAPSGNHSAESRPSFHASTTLKWTKKRASERERERERETSGKTEGKERSKHQRYVHCGNCSQAEIHFTLQSLFGRHEDTLLSDFEDVRSLLFLRPFLWPRSKANKWQQLSKTSDRNRFFEGNVFL